MSKLSKQTTLLQTWGYEGNVSSSFMQSQASQQKPKRPSIEEAFQNDEDDEALLLQALEEADKHVPALANRSHSDPVNFEEVPPIPQSLPTEDLPGFDVEAGRTWIYPTNYPVRQYQFDIVRSCLFDNTLVSLPTGLGKTFIAAVVMYNFYRWYPQGKIVFMAPTKPLVAQQIEACYKIMGVPQCDTAEMTGNVAVSTREKAWKQKRVFFMTPQVMSNDLSRGLFPATQVKLLVVDEAHRAQGEYAYCQVVRELQQSKGAFRVVALSATPGSDLQAVRMMLQNLLISRIELRSEESPDIVPYTFQRKIDKIVVSLGKELDDIKQKLLTVLEIFVRRLAKAGALSRRGNSTNPMHYTKFGLIQARDEYRQNPPARLEPQQRGIVEGDFSSAMSLYHGYELLMQHGMRTFYNFMVKTTGEVSSDATSSPGPSSSNGFSPGVNRRLRYDLTRMPVWNEIMTELKEKFCGDLNHSRLNMSRPQLFSQFGSDPSQKEQFPLGHPKLEKLRDTVIAHFKSKKDENVATRVMIFSQYRDSVQEITAMLHMYKPLVKVMEFVGQSGVNGKKGLTQKEQIEVVKRFKEGGYNTLVATCVGEEGLDIGEVDLIVCYDVSKSPIRLVQRMGRTGRKRAGRIIVLVTEGKEEQTYNTSMYCKNSINKAILEKNKLASFLSLAPRMIPKGIDPVCHKMVMHVGSYISAKSSGKSSIAPGDNKKISSMLKKADKATTLRRSCGYLTDAETLEYLKMFPNPDELFKDLPIIRPKRELWKSSASEVLDQMFEPDKVKCYDLSEWNLWQVEEQPRHFVSKSKNSEFLSGVLSKLKPPSPIVHEEKNDDDDIVIIENVQCSPMTPFEFDDEAVNQVEQNYAQEVEMDQGLKEILGDDDPYRKLHSFQFPQAPSAAFFEDLIKKLPPPEMLVGFNLKEALRCFRAKKLSNRTLIKMEYDENDFDRCSRSPSPVFLSQTVRTKRESSTPMASHKGKKINLCDDAEALTPVQKRLNSSQSKNNLMKNGSSAFDDSFVQFTPSNKTKKDSLYDASQLASMLNHSSSGKASTAKTEPMAVLPSYENDVDDHFESLVRDMSDWQDEHQSLPKSSPMVKQELSDKSPIFNSSVVKKEEPFDGCDHPIADFDIVSESFFERLEVMFACEESNFKIPSLQSYETRTKTTPKSELKKLSQSPSPIVAPKAKHRALFASSEEEDLEEESFVAPPKKVAKKKRKRRNEFIVDEAELSGSASSEGDDDLECLDALEASFVDDATQRVSVDERAIYLQSIKSPARPRSRSVKPVPRMEDIYSQPVTDSMLLDEYEEDSFVVQNDEIEYASSTADELDFVPEFKEDKAAAVVAKKRKRIIVSSSEDEEPPPKAVDVCSPKVNNSSESSDQVAEEARSSRLSSKSSDCDQSVSVLVNASEVHRSQVVISALRHTHNFNVHVQSGFEGAGYLLSSRLAAVRIANSDFCNGGQRHKIVSMAQAMNELFERPCFIVESDGQPFLEVRKHRTKYVDMIISQLAQSNIRVLFSQNQTESASVMASMACKESKKGFGLPSNMKLPLLSERFVPFYSSIPGVSHALSIQIATEFKSPRDFVTAAHATLMRKLKLDEKRARKIHSYFRAHFQPDMTRADC